MKANFLMASDKKLREFAISLSPLVPPKLNAQDFAKARLGKKLFFDQRMSSNGKVACASCHKPELSFTDGLKTGKAIGVGKRNTPSLVNSFALSWNFWDGRADSLVSQALKPVEDAAEHGTNRLQVYRLVAAEYRKHYESLWGAFPQIESQSQNAIPDAKPLTLYPLVQEFLRKQLNKTHALVRGKKRGSKKWLASKKLIFKGSSHPNWVKNFRSMTDKDRRLVNRVYARVGEAIAEFERTIVANQSPFDSFVTQLQKGKPVNKAFVKGFQSDEWKGFKIFSGKGQCMNCHHGPSFSDNQFHNVGFPNHQLDLGRAEGLALLERDEFSCTNADLKANKWLQDLESCQERPFLNYDSIESIAAFKTPSLRNVAETAPYGHAGQFKDLKAVIKHYETLNKDITLGHLSESLSRIKLNAEERNALEAFLKSLSSQVSHL